MSIKGFFDHKCDIYHIVSSSLDIGYGINTVEKYLYSEEPDLKGINCHFVVKNDGVVLVQNDPQTNIEGNLKLTLPCGTEIRVNDRIISKESGLRYRAGIPSNIRNHHIVVMVYREDGINGVI